MSTCRGSCVRIGPVRRAPARVPVSALLDLGLAAQFVLISLQLLLLQLLNDLRLDVFEGGQLGIAHVVEADDVEAELGLDRGFGHLALGELGQCLAELGNVGVGRSPVEVAAALTRSRVLGKFLGQLVELRTLLDLVDQGLGLLFALDQDVACLLYTSDAADEREV